MFLNPSSVQTSVLNVSLRDPWEAWGSPRRLDLLL